MERKAHADGSGGLIDTVSYTREEIDALYRYNADKLASGEATKNDVYELGTVDGKLIEHWLYTKGKTFAQFMADPELTNEFVNSEFFAPFRCWKGRF
jgi:hypothetical protein